MLEENLKTLRLGRIADQLDMWLQEAARHQWPYDEFLSKLCQEKRIPSVKKDNFYFKAF